MLAGNKNVILRMTLTALLLSLNIILSRTPILSIYVTPFVRFSLGPTIVVFSSILLGPISGMIVGGVGDILGIILYNPSGFSINPLISLTYTLLGLTPYLIYLLIKKLNKKTLFILNISLLALIEVAISLMCIFNNEINFGGNNIYALDLGIKLVIIFSSLVILIALGVSIYFINKIFIKKNKDNTNLFYKILFITIICEIIFNLGLNILAKVILFEVNYFFILFPQIIISVINIPICSFVVTYLLLLVNKIIVRKEISNE